MLALQGLREEGIGRARARKAVGRQCRHPQAVEGQRRVLKRIEHQHRRRRGFRLEGRRDDKCAELRARLRERQRRQHAAETAEARQALVELLAGLVFGVAERAAERPAGGAQRPRPGFGPHRRGAPRRTAERAAHRLDALGDRARAEPAAAQAVQDLRRRHRTRAEAPEFRIESRALRGARSGLGALGSERQVRRAQQLAEREHVERVIAERQQPERRIDQRVVAEPPAVGECVGSRIRRTRRLERGREPVLEHAPQAPGALCEVRDDHAKTNAGRRAQPLEQPARQRLELERRRRRIDAGHLCGPRGEREFLARLARGGECCAQPAAGGREAREAVEAHDGGRGVQARERLRGARGEQRAQARALDRAALAAAACECARPRVERRLLGRRPVERVGVDAPLGEQLPGALRRGRGRAHAEEPLARLAVLDDALPQPARGLGGEQQRSLGERGRGALEPRAVGNDPRRGPDRLAGVCLEVPEPDLQRLRLTRGRRDDLPACREERRVGRERVHARDLRQPSGT